MALRAGIPNACPVSKSALPCRFYLFAPKSNFFAKISGSLAFLVWQLLHLAALGAMCQVARPFWGEERVGQRNVLSIRKYCQD